MENRKPGLGQIRTDDGCFKLGAKIPGGVLVFGEDDQPQRCPGSAGLWGRNAWQADAGTAVDL